MKVKELKDLSSDELIQKEKEYKKELFNLNFQRKNGNVEKPSQFKLLKKDIARILTILKERDVEDERSGKKK